MAAKDFPITLSIKAIDKATRPLHAITQKLQGLTSGPLSRTFSRFGHDLSQFGEAAGFSKLGKGFAGVGGAVRKIGGEVFNLGARLFALSGVAAFAFYRILRSAVDAGDKLGEMAQRTGFAVDAYASLQKSAADADVDQEQFNSSMDQFNKRLGEAKAGGGPLLAFLNKVSPALARQVKGAKNSEAALGLMTEAMAKIDDPSKRAALSAAAFGRSGLQIGEWLHQGTDAIKAQQAAYLRTAGSQKKFAEEAGALDNALREVETAFLGLRSTALGELMPAFTNLAGVVTGFIIANRDGIQKWAEGASASINAWVASGGFDRLIASVREFLAVAEVWFHRLGGLKGALIGVGLVMTGPLIASIAALVPAVYGLAVALLTTPVGWIILGLAAIAAAGWAVGSAFGELYNSGVFGKLGDAAGGFLEIWGGIRGLDVERIVRGWTQAIEGFQGALDSLKNLSTTSKVILGLINPGMGGQFAGDAIKGWWNGSSGDAKPALNFSSAEAARPAASAQRTEANVSVSFSNAPPGLRVSTEPNSSQPVDLDVGYSSAGAGI